MPTLEQMSKKKRPEVGLDFMSKNPPAFMPPRFDAPTIPDPQGIIPPSFAPVETPQPETGNRPQFKTTPRDIRAPYHSLEERPQTIGVHPPPTTGEKIKRFFVSEPKYGRWTKPQRLDYLHRVLDVPLSILTKFASGRAFGADELSWYALSKIRPDLADKPLEEQMAELSPYEKSGFQKMAGGLAKFIGQIQSASRLLKTLGFKPPKGKKVVDVIKRTVPPWMTSGAVDALVEGIVQEEGAKETAKKVAKRAIVRGGTAIAVSGVQVGAGKLFNWALKRFPRFNAGWKKWTKGRKPAEVRTARQEADEALRIYKETGDRTAWDNVRIKYAGITPEGIRKIEARRTLPAPSEIGKPKITTAEKNLSKALQKKTKISKPIADKAAELVHRQGKSIAEVDKNFITPAVVLGEDAVMSAMEPQAFEDAIAEMDAELAEIQRPARQAPIPATQPTTAKETPSLAQISPSKPEITPPAEAAPAEKARKPLPTKEVMAKKEKYAKLPEGVKIGDTFEEAGQKWEIKGLGRATGGDVGIRAETAKGQRGIFDPEFIQQKLARPPAKTIKQMAEEKPAEPAKAEKPPVEKPVKPKEPEVGFVETEPTTGEKFFHKAATQAQKEKAYNIAKKKAFISEKGKPRPGYRALARAMTGQSSVDKMTEQQAKDFIDALGKLPEPKMRGGRLIPPSIPRTTALVPKGFFQRRFKRPTPASLITSQTYYAEKLGVKSLVEPLEKAKMSFDLEYRKAANDLDKMGKAIDKVGKTTAKEKGAAKVKNIPTKARMEIGDLLDQYEEAPENLDPKKKEIFAWFRHLTRTILNRQNEARAKLDLPPIKGRKAYMRHIATDISREMLAGKYPFPEGIGFWSRLRTGKKVFNPMEFQRKLEEDIYGLFSRDPVYASKAMMYTALKEIHLNQPLKFFNEQLNALGKDLPEYKNLSPREKAELSKVMVIPADTRRWLTDYVNTVIKGRQTNTDRLVNNIVNESGLKGLLNIVLHPFGRTISRKPITGFFQKAGRMQMAGVMGPRPRLLIRNKFQLTQNMALYGMKANIRAFLPPNKELKGLLDESLFLKSYTGLEELPPDLAKKIEKLWHKAYQWTATSNAKQAMEVAYWDIKELIENPKYKKYGWKPEHLLKEMEFGAAATQYQYNAIGMPGIFRHKSLIPVTRLTSWWMNYFAKFHREALHRVFTGRPSWAGEEGPTLPWSRRLGWLRYAIIGGLILNKMGYYRSYMFGAAPTGWPPAMQAASSLYRYVIADDEKKRKTALRKFWRSIKTFIPGYIAYKDIEKFRTTQDWKSLLFYKKKEEKAATE